MVTLCPLRVIAERAELMAAVAATWLPLSSTIAARLMRWLVPPPARTAYLSSALSPGQRGDAGHALQESSARAVRR